MKSTVALLLVSVSACANPIRLRNGMTLTGDVTWSAAKGVTYRSASGVKSYGLSELDRDSLETVLGTNIVCVTNLQNKVATIRRIEDELYSYEWVDEAGNYGETSIRGKYHGPELISLIITCPFELIFPTQIEDGRLGASGDSTSRRYGDASFRTNDDFFEIKIFTNGQYIITSYIASNVVMALQYQRNPWMGLPLELSEEEIKVLIDKNTVGESWRRFDAFKAGWKEDDLDRQEALFKTSLRCRTWITDSGRWASYDTLSSLLTIQLPGFSAILSRQKRSMAQSL